MKGIIMSAGYGSRLAPLTWFTPKCMIRVKGKPVIEYSIDHLNRFGITDITINLHYKSMDFIKYLGSRVRYLYEDKLLGEEGTIETLAPYLDDYTVIMNGDTLTNIDIPEMFKFSRGENVKSMDGEVYTGTRIIKPYYRKGRNCLYSNSETRWLDVGTFKGLRKANYFVERYL